jgi:hypothetical protein
MPFLEKQKPRPKMAMQTWGWGHTKVREKVSYCEVLLGEQAPESGTIVQAKYIHLQAG